MIRARGAYDGAVTDDGSNLDENASQPQVVAVSVTKTVAPRQASATAVAATVALVMFSVFIGVYGPRLGNRQQSPAGTTLVELATAIEPRHAQRVFEAMQTSGSGAKPFAQITREDAEAAATKIVGQPVFLPKLDGFEVRFLAPTRVRLPGASGALVFCAVSVPRANGRTDPALAAFASILILEDEDRFTSFDTFGRPVSMPEGEVFSVMVKEGRDPASVAMFRVRDLVYGVQASEEELASELVAELELRAAEAVSLRSLEN